MPPNHIPRSCLPQTKDLYSRSGIDIQGAIQIAPGMLPIGAILGVTQKLELFGTRCRYTSEEDMCGIVDQLYSKQVILYDDSAKTAYLCRLINLIVSLVRAYLRDNGYEYDTKLLNFETGVEHNQANIRRVVTEQTDLCRAFKELTKRYAKINAVLRQRNTKSVIFGFEAVDILKGHDFYARKLSVTNGVEAWNALAELTDVVFCGGYGDVILSSDRAQCSVKPPHGCNVLICPLALLREHFDDVDGKCFKQRGRQSFVWTWTGRPFECRMLKGGRGCDGRECWVDHLQCINRPCRMMKKVLKNQHNMQSVSLDNADGAIGFGKLRTGSRSKNDAKSSGSGSVQVN